MPKRNQLFKIDELQNEIDNYIPIDRDLKNWLIQKTKPLLTLSNSSMTLPELKILDVYLSRIDSHDTNNRHVRFEKGHLEELLGVEKLNKSDLDRRLRNLFQVLEIRDDSKPKGFTLISLFSKAECIQDENGLWQVDLACSPEAMEYMFFPENIGYLKYRLKNIINLSSRYSYILFLYLTDNNFRHTWTIELNELKYILNCTAETYSEYKHFNNLILKRCQKDINEKTDLNFTYNPIRNGRKVTKISFTVVSSGEISYDEKSNDQLFIERSNAFDEDIDYGSELANLLGSACNNEFSKVQIRLIQDLVIKASGTTDNLERTDYLTQKLHAMEYYNTRNEIKDRFSYLCKILETDIKEGD